MKLQMTALVLGLCLASAANGQSPESTPAPSPAPPATAAPAVPAAAAPVEAPRVFLEKVTVVVDGKAEYAGSIQLEFAPVGEPGKTIEVRVLAKTGFKEIAKDLFKEITLAAGSAYKVKQSGGEIRISKAAKAAKNFSVVVRKLDLTGVSVLVKKG